MNVITVSREYGAGGGEVAQLLAKSLGWELLDRELLHRAAAVEAIPDADLEKLDEQAVRFTDRFRLHPPHERYRHGLTEAVRAAAAHGHVILVGRGTRQILGEVPNAFHLRLVAPRDWRAQRMVQREGWTPERALVMCASVDRSRDRFTRYFFGADATASEQYDLVVNSSRVPPEDVAELVTELVRQRFFTVRAGSARQVLTLSRQFGAGETSFARALAERLKLKLFDRELLEQQAVQLRVSEADLARVDEQPPDLLERLRSGGLSELYLKTLRQIMLEVSEAGNVLIVGRGGHRFLQDQAGTFHVRVVAELEVRIRRVMEHRWVREAGANQLIEQSDDQRREFVHNIFGADWADPKEYHLTVNSGRLGPTAVDLVAAAAERHWSRNG